MAVPLLPRLYVVPASVLYLLFTISLSPDCTLPADKSNSSLPPFPVCIPLHLQQVRRYRSWFVVATVFITSPSFSTSSKYVIPAHVLHLRSDTFSFPFASRL